MIHDHKFIAGSKSDTPDTSNFNGIADSNAWAFDQIAELIGTRKPPALDDPLPTGTSVTFTAPDGTSYVGKVAAKSGDDYIVAVTPGESYLVPPGKLAKVTPEADRIRGAVRDEIAPSLQVISERKHIGRHIVRVAYLDRHPADGQLMAWASLHYPELRLVDAEPQPGRNIDLIFEMSKQASFLDDITPIVDRYTDLDAIDLLEMHPQGIAFTGSTAADAVSDCVQEISEVAKSYGIPEHPPYDSPFGVIFSFGTTSKMAAEDVRPQGSAPHRPGERGQPLSSEEIEGTGVIGAVESKIPGGLSEKPLEDGVKVEMEHTDDPEIAKEIAMDHLIEDPKYYEKLKRIEAAGQEFSLDDVVKTAQLGEPGAAEQYEDLSRAARWIISRFNDSNPEYYAVPQEVEVAGDHDNRIVRLSFTLNAKDAQDKLSDLYISRQGSISTDPDPDSKPVRGFVQVDASGNLPMMMISGPTGPESIQEYGFNLAAMVKIATEALAQEIYEISKKNAILRQELNQVLSSEGSSYIAPPQQIIEVLTKVINEKPEVAKRLSQFVEGSKRPHLQIGKEPGKTVELISSFPGQPTRYHPSIKPLGHPESGPEYEGPYSVGSKQAQHDACVIAANEVLSAHGGYSAAAQQDFEARLVKLAVDPEAKKYWSGYFKDYGKKFTSDVPRKKHKAQVEHHKEVDPHTVDYWVNYFGSSAGDDSWYGRQLVRTIPKKQYRGDGTITSVDSDDEEGVIGNPREMFSHDKQAQIKPVKTQKTKMRQKPMWQSLKERAKPGFFEQIRQIQKVEPIKQQAEQAAEIARALLPQAKIDRSTQLLVTSIVSKFLQQNPGYKTKAYNELRMQDPNFHNRPQDNQRDAMDAFILTYALASNQGWLQAATNKIREISQKWTQSTGPEVGGVPRYAEKIAASDYAAYIQKTPEGYEVKSEKNPKWSGGTYKTKEEAEKRLKQVEMFKHMAFVDCGGNIDSDTLFDAITGCIVIHYDPVGVLTQVSDLIDHSKLAQTDRNLQDVVNEAIKRAEDDPAFSNQISRIYYGYLAQNPEAKWEVLKGTGRRHLGPEEIAKVLYMAVHQRPYFKQLKKLLTQESREQEKKFWSGLGEERKKLLQEKREQQQKPWLKWIKEKVLPSKPEVKPEEVPEPVKSQKPWEREEPEFEDLKEPAAPSPAPAPKAPPTAPVALQPSEEVSTEVERDITTEPEVTEPKITKPEETKPTPSVPTKDPFGPREERIPKPIPLSKEVTAPVKTPPTPGEEKIIKEVAKEFLPEGKGKHREFMQAVLNYMPYPKPETPEARDYYEKKIKGIKPGYRKYMDMTVKQIADNDPYHAYEFLVPSLNSQHPAAGRALLLYLEQMGVLGDIMQGKRPKKPKEKEEKGRRVVWKGETPSPEVTKEKEFEPPVTSVDDFKIPEFSGGTIPGIMKQLWDKKKQLSGFLDVMAIRHPDEIIQWGREALPKDRATEFENNINRRRERLETKKVTKPLSPVEEEEAITSIKEWRIPENEEIPAFAGNTIAEALAKHRDATVKYMLHNQPDKWLAFVKMVYPNTYDYWVQKVEALEEELTKPEKKPEPKEPLVKQVMEWKIPKGQYAGNTIPEIMTILRDPESGRLTSDQADFMAYIYENYPEQYVNYIKTMHEDVQDKFNKVVTNLVREKSKTIEEPEEASEEIPDETPEAISPEEAAVRGGLFSGELSRRRHGAKWPSSWMCPRCDSMELSSDEMVCEECSKELAEKLSAIYGVDVDPQDIQFQGEYETRKKLDLIEKEFQEMKGKSSMRRWSKAGPGPHAYNAPGKDDREDYDYQERNRQPSKSRTRFQVTRMYSTTSSDESGYVIMEVGWDPERFKDMSPQNVQHQLITFVKGLESDKYYHDFGIMGRPRIIEFDEDAGVAKVKVRCSETRGIMSITYGVDKDEVNKVPLSGIR